MRAGLRHFFAGFRRDISWTTRSQRVWFHLWGICLSLYLTYALYWAGSSLLTSSLKSIEALVWGLIIALLIYLGFLRICRLAVHGLPWVSSQRGRLSPLFFAVCMGLGLLMVSGSFLAAYPGGVSYDVYNQWTQARTGLYNSWHPVLHTLLMGLGARITGGSYSWVLLLQIFIVCGAVAYLMSTLQAWGMPRLLLLILEGLMMASSLISGTMMYLWKDNAMTVGALVLCTQCVNVYFSRGTWLTKWSNAALMGFALAFATLVRHNGMFYTVPLLLCLLLVYGKPIKKLLPLAGVFVLASGLVLGPLYGNLDIVHPHNTYEESIGLPMTVLMSQGENPSALERKRKCSSLAWCTKILSLRYRPGDYNSIKFTYPREKITVVPPQELMGMVISTIRNDPRGALEAVNQLTDLVWDVTGKNEAVVAVGNSGDLPDVPAQNSRINRLGQAFDGFLRGMMDFAPLAWLFENIGVQMALLLLGALWALYRKGEGALLLALPVLAYNIGTMLLLCGNDARFFQFSMVISLPSLLVLCQQRPSPDADDLLPITREEE